MKSIHFLLGGMLAVCLAAASLAESRRRTPIVSAVEKTRDCVVNISAEKIVLKRSRDRSRSADPFDRLFDDFFQSYRYERTRVVQPLGSGVILDERGLVATNAHVIRRAGELRLSLADGTQLKAKLLAADFDNDLALLRIQEATRKFKSIHMSRSQPVLGETVIALGNPFGLSNSVTSGIVSSVDRKLTIGEGRDKVSFTGLIQTSALINPGNSGGPLVNLDAELVGINTAIVDHAQGIGFSIPARQVRKVLAELLSTPDVSHVWLGLAFKPGPPLRVARLAPGSPAAKAGLKVGDLIQVFSGRPANDAFDVGMALLYRRPGDRIEVRSQRNGRRRDVTVVLAKPKLPSEQSIVSRKLGVRVQDVDGALARSMNLPVAWGVLVAKVEQDGPAHRAGIAVGDLIVRVGRYRVQTIQQAGRLLRKARSGDTVYLAVVRGGYLARALVRLR